MPIAKSINYLHRKKREGWVRKDWKWVKPNRCILDEQTGGKDD